MNQLDTYIEGEYSEKLLEPPGGPLIVVFPTLFNQLHYANYFKMMIQHPLTQKLTQTKKSKPNQVKKANQEAGAKSE